MQPWKYDYTVHPVAWRDEAAKQVRETKALRFGVMRTDGIVEPSPACARGLEMVVSALKDKGHECVDVSPPDTYEALRLASRLLNSDGCETFSRFFRTGETCDPGAAQMRFYARLPRWIKRLYAWWVRYVRRDAIWAGLLEGWGPVSAEQQWRLVAQREAYRARFFEWWNHDVKVDFVLTVPNATPAVPHDGMHDAVSSCGYTFLWNLLDYSAGVLPITKVDRDEDKWTGKLKDLNGVARGAYMHYDANKMHGLPVGVQIVGGRLCEERVLAAMEVVEEAFGGRKYQQLELDVD
jgi:Asp-tRNA(Asn)/Glu-tRNA(Gln) amidotransferase A subunit family amidase